MIQNPHDFLLTISLTKVFYDHHHTLGVCIIVGEFPQVGGAISSYKRKAVRLGRLIRFVDTALTQGLHIYKITI